MHRYFAITTLSVCALLPACATSENNLRHDFMTRAAAHDARIESIPPPASAEQKSEVCKYLRIERSKMQSGIYSASQYSGGDSSVAAYMRSEAIIEAKMSEFGC